MNSLINNKKTKLLFLIAVLIIIIAQQMWIYSVKPQPELFYTPAYEVSFSKEIAESGKWDVQTLVNDTRGEYVLYPMLHIFSVALFEVMGVDFFTSCVWLGALLSIFIYLIFFVACTRAFGNFLISAAALAYLSISDFTHFLWSNAIRETFSTTLFVILFLILFSMFNKHNNRKNGLLIFIGIIGISLSHPLNPLFFVTSVILLVVSEILIFGYTKFKWICFLAFTVVLSWYLYMSWAYALNYHQMFTSLLDALLGNSVASVSVVSFETGGTVFLLLKLSALAVGGIFLLIQIYKIFTSWRRKSLAIRNNLTLFRLWLTLSCISTLMVYGLSRFSPWGALNNIADSATRFEPYLFIMLAFVIGFSLRDMFASKIIGPKIFRNNWRICNRMTKNYFVMVLICVFLVLNLAIFTLAPTIRLLKDANDNNISDYSLIYSQGSKYVSTQMNDTTLTSSNELVFFRHAVSLFSSAFFIKEFNVNKDMMLISSRFSDIVLDGYFAMDIIDIRGIVSNYPTGGLYLMSIMDAPVYQFSVDALKLDNSSLIYSNGQWLMYKNK